MEQESSTGTKDRDESYWSNYINRRVEELLADKPSSYDKRLNDLRDFYELYSTQLEDLQADVHRLQNSSSIFPLINEDASIDAVINMVDRSITINPPIAKVVLIDDFNRRVKESSYVSQDGPVHIKRTSIFDCLSQFSKDEIEAIPFNKEESTPKYHIPPVGDFKRPTLKEGDSVLACTNPEDVHNQPWEFGKIDKVYEPFSFDVVFPKETFRPPLFLESKHIAYGKIPDVCLKQGVRVAALQSHGQKKNNFLAGFVAEPPKPSNKGRYLVFFEDQSVSYVPTDKIFVIAQAKSSLDEAPDNLRTFLKEYLNKYPERTMIKFHEKTLNDKKSKIKVLLDGEWVKGHVYEIDCSIVKLFFKNLRKSEWLYRGSSRFQMLYDTTKIPIIKKPRPIRKTTSQRNLYMKNGVYKPFVQYDVNDDQDDKDLFSNEYDEALNALTTYKPSVVFKVGKLVQKVERKFSTRSYKGHRCDYICIRGREPMEFQRDINPFAVPIMWGWTRECSLYRNHGNGQEKHIFYVAPCGRRLRSIKETDRYLAITNSLMSIDCFSFDSRIKPFHEITMKKNEEKYIYFDQDLAKGSEKHSISCINNFNSQTLPSDFEYQSKRTAREGVPLELDNNFLDCCSCEDNCQNADTCECQRRTRETAKRHYRNTNKWTFYEYRRLKDSIPSGIWECNKNCQCSTHRCHNRVVQNGIIVRLQIFFTGKKGWGIRTLHDVPAGTFMCTYSAEILSFKDTIEEGTCDTYFADLDYIDTVEEIIKRKEGYEEAPLETLSSDPSDSDSEDEKIGYHKYKKMKKQEKRATKKVTSQNKRKPIRKDQFKSIRSFFNESDPYTLDADRKGNIGRFINHSCEPNCFVQNVFVDSHDLRFPWVAFFSNRFIPAFTELTWHYGYKVNSIKGKNIPCYCGSSHCRKRLI